MNHAQTNHNETTKSHIVQVLHSEISSIAISSTCLVQTCVHKLLNIKLFWLCDTAVLFRPACCATVIWEVSRQCFCWTGISCKRLKWKQTWSPGLKNDSVSTLQDSMIVIINVHTVPPFLSSYTHGIHFSLAFKTHPASIDLLYIYLMHWHTLTTMI